MFIFIRPTVEETAPVEAVATENKEAEPATNGKEANGDATNGDSTVHTTETNGDHVKEANGHGKEETNGNGVESNGNGVESNGHSKEDTNGVAEVNIVILFSPVLRGKLFSE